MRPAADPGDEAGRDLANRCLAPLVSQGNVPSLAYAVVRDSGVALGGFGGASPRTIFEIGSVTKVFTALLLADLAERGRLRLADPAARYLPGGGSGQVTLADLATHTAGLPRLPPRLGWFALASPRDPYAHYPAGWLVRAGRRSLGTASRPNPYTYSNYGYGLLGYLLGQAAGAPYERLVAERICGPLGLGDTTFEVRSADRGRLAQGHARRRPAPAWHLGALAAAGGLRSTAADLAALLRACLAPDDTPLAAAIRATLAPRAEIPSGQIGLAWHHSRRGPREIIWHNGMTGGFSAMIAFDPGRGLGVAALADTAGALPSPLDEAVFAAVRAVSP